MKKVKIKADLDRTILEELGYAYSIMEGGYISEDGATIISINRRPYEREIQQYSANSEDKNLANIEQLRKIGALEE